MIQHTTSFTITFHEDELAELDTLREWADSGTVEYEVRNDCSPIGATPSVTIVATEQIPLRDNDLLFEIVKEVTGYPFPEMTVWRATVAAGPTSTSGRLIEIQGRSR